MNKEEVRYDNPKMQRTCNELKKELTKLCQNIDVMLGERDDPYMRFIPYENADKAKDAEKFIRWMLTTFKNYFNSNQEVYKFVGYLNKRMERLDNEIVRKEHQTTLFPEEEVRVELQALQIEKKRLLKAKRICKNGRDEFEYLFHYNP